MDCMQVRLVRSIGVVWGHPLGGTGREWELFNGRCGQSAEHKSRGRLTEISLPFCHQSLHITGHCQNGSTTFAPNCLSLNRDGCSTFTLCLPPFHPWANSLLHDWDGGWGNSSRGQVRVAV